MFNYFLFKFAQFLSLHLPLRMRNAVAYFFADIQFYLSKKDRTAVKENLQVILQRKNVLPETREVFRNFAKYLTSFFRMPLINKEYVSKNVKIVGLKYIDDALKKKRGAIILAAHFGNWELGGVLISMLGYRFAAIALPHKNKHVNKLFNQQRECYGANVIALGNAARKAIEALNDNQLLALVGDRDFTNTGFSTDFFGKKTMIPKGPVMIAAKTKSPIIPAFVIQEKGDRHRFFFEKPIEIPENLTDKEALIPYAKKCLEVIKKYIKMYPTQWSMFRKFWIES